MNLDYEIDLDDVSDDDYRDHETQALQAHGILLTGDCEADCQIQCAYPGQFSECST